MKREPTIGRRQWLLGGAAALTLGGAATCHWAPGLFRAEPSSRAMGLRPDPVGLLDLREGFRYRILSRSGETMGDGRRVPTRPDGMACFDQGNGRWVLMRNHELPSFAGMRNFYPDTDTRLVHDSSGAGAVTRVVLDAQSLQVRSQNLVLAGTAVNCAGGQSPWGWMSCEESTMGDHGYVFLCDTDAETLTAPRRIDAYGRFKHEAVALHPDSHVAYLTEDRTDSSFYKFVPHDPDTPFEGTLYAMRLRSATTADTSRAIAGDHFDVDWIRLGDTDTPEDDLRYRAQRAGAARVKRGEGCCVGGRSVFFCATSGGPVEGGQIFKLDDEGDGGTLEALASSTDLDLLEMPDNLVIGPHGMVFVVEDGPGPDHLRYVDGQQRMQTLARNAYSDGELTGICFSPDFRVLFVNMQEEGLTVAVEGPFEGLV